MISRLKLLLIFIVSVVAIVSISIVVFVYYQTPRAITFLQRIHPSPTPAPLSIKGMGVIGDSLSDEYRADDSRGLTYASTTINWVELLAKQRNLPVGEWGLREEPRRQGYEFNFARTGENINDAIDAGQHIGLAELIKEKKVNMVVIYIGVNDFSPLAPEGYEAIYSGNVTDSQITRKINRIVADMRTIVETLQSSGEVHILVVTLPDWGKHNLVQLAFPLLKQRNKVGDAITRTNTELTKLGQEEGFAVANIDDFYGSLGGHDTEEGVKIGGLLVNKYIPGDDPRNLFLDDGVHPGTLYNGLFANFIMTNLNTKLGTQLRLFTEKEITSAAGL